MQPETRSRLPDEPVVVYDTNCWIHGITESEPAYALYFRQLLRDEVPIAVSAYIYNEVIEAFARGQDAGDDEWREQRGNFAEIVAKADNVVGPRRAEVEEMDVGTVRRSAEATMLSSLTGVQSKDIPVLTYAWACPGETLLFTCDRSFARFEPTDTPLSGIRMEYLPSRLNLEDEG